jgi:FlaG/FlaF family flagellin (archaellin)
MAQKPGLRTERGVSPAIAVLLMAAVAIILAASIGAFVLGFGEETREPAPNVAETTGEFVPGADEQVVRITHVAGDNVPVEEIEIIVRASGPGDDLPLEARLVNLPAEGSDLDSVNIEGAEIVSEGFGESGPSDPNQAIIEDFPTDDNTWDAGDMIRFEINVDADFRDPPVDSDNEADTLEVSIVHIPSNAIIFEDTFTPSGG